MGYESAEQGVLNLAKAAVQTPASMQERRAASEDVLADINSDIGRVGTFQGAAQPPPAMQPPVASAAPSTGLLSQDGYNFSDTKTKNKYNKLLKKGYSSEEAAKQLPADKVMSGDSIFTRSATGSGGAGYIGGKTNMTTLELDKDKAKAKIENSPMFNIVSQMTAESQQLLNRSGPLYDEMMQSTQLPIIESSAALARENTENIRQAMARGGSARRDAFEAVQTIRAQDAANMQKGQALAQAHLQMDQWSRQYAQSTVAFAQNWSANQAGIRESFNSAMDTAAALFENSALPFAFGAEQQVQKWREAQSAQSRGTVNRWIGGILGLAEGVMTAYRGGDPSKANAQFMGISGGQPSAGGDSNTSLGSLIGGVARNFGIGSPSNNTVTSSSSFDTSGGQTITNTPSVSYTQ